MVVNWADSPQMDVKMRLTQKEIDQFVSDREYKKYYGYMLGKFRGEIGEFNEDNVRRFGDRYDKKSSTNTWIQVARSFAKWKKRRIPPDHPEREILRHELGLVRDIRSTRVVTRLKKEALSTEEIEELFKLLKGLKFSGLWCLAWLGCRPGELLLLDTDDPDYSKGEVVMDTEKTRVQRKLFFDGFTGGHLKEFLESGFGYQYLYNTCLDLRSRIGMKNLSPKTFRKCFETHMQRRMSEASVHTVRLDLLIKLALGHTVGDIAGVYTDVTRDLELMFRKYHYLIPLEENFR